MHGAVKKIVRCENLSNARYGVKTSVLLILRYWLCYRISHDDSYLHKAYHSADALSRANACSIELYLINVFISIESGFFEKGAELLDALNPYRNYYKNNHALLYAWMQYLSALAALHTGKERQAQKTARLLETCCTESGSPAFSMILGAFKLETDDVDAASQYLIQSYDRGCRSSFLFVQLLHFFDSAENPVENIAANHELLIPLMNWGFAQGADLNDLVNDCIDCEESGARLEIFDDMHMCEKIYAAYPGEWITRRICVNLMEAGDVSQSALEYYLAAESKQIHLPGLEVMLVKAAYRNKSEDISRYAMERFLSESGEMDEGLKAFVYHLLLTRRKFAAFLPQHENEIMQFALFGLEHNMTGRHSNSLYKYVIDRGESMGVPADYIAKCTELLWPQLFVYDVFSPNPAARYVWIMEKEKAEPFSCEMTAGCARVKASCEFFSYACFTEGLKSVADEKIRVLKPVESSDIGLYLYFYRNGYVSLDLIVALARYYISLSSIPDESVNMSKGILNVALSLDGLSRSFKMQAAAALANILYSHSSPEQALSYYKNIDESYLSDKYIEQMLGFFIQMEEYDRALALIGKKTHCLSERALFSALKQLATHEKYRPLIADSAYELVLKSWYDKTLTEIVIRYYKGCQAEWQELSRVLSNMSASDIALDELILKNSIDMHKFDTGAQKVYARMFENSPGHDLVEGFTYYCVYEIMINNVRPEYETIMILEKKFAETDERLLAYALCGVYIEHELSTIESERIITRAIEFMKEDGIIFPIVKDMKDKRALTPYIEKNQPFLYRCAPNKNVFLYYKIDGDTEYKKVRMKYFRFGIYAAAVTHFYGEKMLYYFSEEVSTGSIVTKEREVDNQRMYFTHNSNDPYFTINNALIYEHMFRYEQVEEIITKSLKEHHRVKASLI